jgi:hypothetical protein
LFGSDGFLIVIGGSNGINDRLFPLCGVHTAAFEGVVLAGTLVNLETTVATQGTGAVVVGTGFLGVKTRYG